MEEDRGWLVGFIALAVGIAFWATSGVVGAVDRQLELLRKGDLRAAYAETSTSFRDNIPFEKFEAFVKEYPGLSRNASRSFPQRSVRDNATGSVSGTLTDDRGGMLRSSTIS